MSEAYDQSRYCLARRDAPEVVVAIIRTTVLKITATAKILKQK